MATMADSEKITINLGPIDLGQIDLLVQEGFYANRTDFIRTAIRTLLASREAAVNQTVARRDPTAHAELLAIQQALQVVASDRLEDCTLYVTLEPCAQCAGALVLAKVGRLVFGAYDDKAGMCGSVGDLVRHQKLNHRLEVQGGVMEEPCGDLLSEFFQAKR